MRHWLLSLLLAMGVASSVVACSKAPSSAPPPRFPVTPTSTATPTATPEPPLTWERVATLPGNDLIWSLHVEPGNIYLGTRNRKEGAELWKVSQQGSSFTAAPIAQAGLGNRQNIDLYGFQYFNGSYYAGTFNPEQGASLLRSADWTTWETVASNGLGERNFDFISFDLFRPFPIPSIPGVLLVGTWNLDDQGQVWRSTDGVAFKKVLDLPRYNSYAWSLRFWDNYEWAIGRGQLALYYSSDAINWLPREPRSDDPVKEGGRGSAVVFGSNLWLALSERSNFWLLIMEHGSWNQTAIPRDQFPQSLNQLGTFNLLAHQYPSGECLLVGTHTAGSSEAAKVYRSLDGKTFEPIFQGTAPLSENIISAMQSVGGRVVIAVGNQYKEWEGEAARYISNRNPCS